MTQSKVQISKTASEIAQNQPQSLFEMPQRLWSCMKIRLVLPPYSSARRVLELAKGQPLVVYCGEFIKTYLWSPWAKSYLLVIDSMSLKRFDYVSLRRLQ